MDWLLFCSAYLAWFHLRSPGIPHGRTKRSPGASHKNQASADALADTRAPRRPRQSRLLSASEPVSEPKDEGQEAAPNATWNEHVK